MDKDLIGRFNRASKLSIFLNDPAQITIYTGNATYVTAVGNFNTTKTKWDLLIPLEAALTAGTTDAKLIAKHSMAEYWASVAQTVRGTALMQSPPDVIIAEDMKRTASAIYNKPDAEAKGVCDYLSTKISDLITAGNPSAVGVITADITAGNVITTAFASLIGKPHNLEDARTAVVGQIVLVDEEMTARIEALTALTAGHFFNGKTASRLAYEANKEVDDLPTEHTELTLAVINRITGTPIAVPHLSDTRAGGKTADGNNLGVVVLSKFKGGEAIRFKVSGTGVADKDIIQTIVTGHKVSLTVMMDPV